MCKTVILIKDTGLSSDVTRDYQSHFIKAARDLGMEKDIQVVRAADLGIYNKGVVVKIIPLDIVYANVQLDQIEQILNVTVKQGPPSRIFFTVTSIYKPDRSRWIKKVVGRWWCQQSVCLTLNPSRLSMN